jgi:hypothetical protein
MARYKGQLEPKTIERQFPHIVELAVPGCGLLPYPLLVRGKAVAQF